MTLTLDTFRRALAPLQRRLGLIVGWAKIHRVDSSQNAGAAQIELVAGEISDDVMMAESYGMTATPLPEALGVVLCIAGERDSAIVTHTPDPRYRPLNLPPGDVCLYTHQDDRTAGAEAAQHRLQLTADRTVVLTARRVKILCGDQSFIIDDGGITATAKRVDWLSASGA